MANPWFKLYGSEYLSDPKIGSLTAQERSCWITLLCMASTSTIGGMIEFLTVEVLLEKSGIHFDPYHPEEWDTCLSILSKFERMKMIEKYDNGNIEIMNWSKRQESSMSATERSRKFRAKSRLNEDNETDATKCNENETLDKNRIDKNRVYINTKKNKLSLPKRLSFDEQIEPFKNKYCERTITDFTIYWKETNQKGKEKWELEKTWDIGLRLQKWERNQIKWQQEKEDRLKFKNTTDEQLSTKHTKPIAREDKGFEKISFGQ